MAGTTLVAASAYGYDQASRLTGLTHTKGVATLAAYTWSYDVANRVTGKTTTADGAAAFGYDSGNQLTTASGPGPANNHTYDLAGNRTTAGYQPGPYNRTAADGTYTYTYDNEGNRTKRTNVATGATDEYTWDYRNRLTRVLSKTAGGVVTKDVLYTYDALDQRVRKQVDSNGDGTYETAESYAHSGGQLALAFNGSNQVQERYLYGPGVDQVLAVERAGAVQWLLGDDQGTVRDVLDGSGNVINHLAVDAFGVVVSQTNASVPVRFVYTGRELDPETGLYQYRARYYDAAVGRFVSEDPIGFAGGDPNLYRYVGNSATNLTDPSGLRPQTPLDIDVQFLGGIPWVVNGDEVLRPASPQDYLAALARHQSQTVAWAQPTTYPPMPPSEWWYAQEGESAGEWAARVWDFNWSRASDKLWSLYTEEEHYNNRRAFIAGAEQAERNGTFYRPSDPRFSGSAPSGDAWLYEAAQGYQQYRQEFFDTRKFEFFFQKVAVDSASVLSLPVGLGRLGIEAVSGYDLSTGDRLSGWDQVLRGSLAALPFGITALGAGRAQEWARLKAEVTSVGTQRFPNKAKLNDFTAELAKGDVAARSVLDKRLGGKVPGGDGKSAHHIVPWEYRDHEVVKAAARGGWNMNGVENGVLLPTNPVHPQGWAHPKYNLQMGQILDDLATRNLTDAQAGHALRKLGDIYGPELLRLTTKLP